MIRHPGKHGVAFSQASDGDQKDPENRAALAGMLGISDEWAHVRQVHGATVHRVDSAGPAGDGDAIWTSASQLPVAVFTADCFGVVVGSDDAVGVAHAGWRGAVAGVVATLIGDMESHGFAPIWSALGPGIDDCCFEVGPEVAERFPGHTSQTTWGTRSVNLRGAVKDQLGDLPLWNVESCTYSDEGWFSYRRRSASERLVTLAWLP